MIASSLRCVAAALLISLSMAAPAMAQEGGDGDKAMVQQGAADYAAGRYRDAVVKWQGALSSLGAERGWKLHYNLGLAYGELGDATLAAEHHAAFLERVAKETATLSASLEERREDAAAKLAAIKAEHGALVLPPQPNDVSVAIDGGSPRAVGFTAYLTPGEHTLQLSAHDGARRDEHVTVSAGQSARIDTTLKLEPVAPPQPQPQPTPEPVAADERSFPTVVVLVGTGLTALAFVLPGVMWGKASSKFEAAEDLGKGHTGYPDKVQEYEDARTVYHASYALPAGLGAITLGVAIYGLIHISGGDSTNAALRVGPGSLAIEGAF